jgi:hypothetical protein
MGTPSQENLRGAILKKKARIAEIERILNRPPVTEYRGQPVHGGQGWRLRLEEERQHLLLAAAELEGEQETQEQASAKPLKSHSLGFVLSGPTGDFSHSDDYRSVTLGGKTYNLTGRQAQFITILHTAFQTGKPDVAIDYILEQLGTPNARWQDTWRSNKEARTALIKGGTTRKGTLSLKL